jgi:hypothetical protein
VRGEHGPVGEVARDVDGAAAGHGEAHRGGARALGRRAVHGHARHAAQPVPHPAREPALVRGEAGVAAQQPGAARPARLARGVAGRAGSVRHLTHVGIPGPVRRVAERGEEVDRGARAGHRLEVLRAGLEPVGGRVGGRGDARHVERGEEVGPAPEEPRVGAVELVRRAGEEVDARLGEAPDVDRGVRRPVHGVDEGERARVAGEPGGAGDVGDGAQRVRRRAHGDEPGARADQRGQVVPVEPEGAGVHARGAHGDAALVGQRRPRGDVAVVVELGHHHLVARAERAAGGGAGGHAAAEGAREVEGERGHVGAEGHLGGAGAQQIRGRAAGAVDHGVGLLARGEGPLGRGVVVEQVAATASATSCGTCVPPGPSK